VWDARAGTCQGAHALPDKVFALAVSGTRVVVATAGRHVHVYDQRNLAEPEQRRESSLQHQTRCVRAFPDGAGYTLSSVEGRVAVEFFDPAPEAQRKKYAFKCHRANVGGVDYVYPVNAIAFHPQHGTFATGGCDGFVNVWDGANRKRLCQFHRYPTGIAAMDFSSDGSLLAIAASYTYEEGERDHPPDTVFIRSVTDADVKPKPRK
jgi:cell cycle arrest protein BUB3